VDELVLDWGGPVGDRHHGVTMRSDTRQRWLYPAGQEIRNNRQLSLVDTTELAQIAARMGLPELSPGTVADNICTDGIADLTATSPMSRLVIGEDDPVVVVLAGENTPCTIAGGLVQARYGTPAESFPKAAIHLRGVTGWVERPGTVQVGMPVRVVPTRPTA
jgi:MOSC domain-containing protein YiiM